ncbi:hypothetical protein SH203_00029 [Brevundimonas sp. SH203]|uniref:hypothetical protein n=1 Tax=Brevundimonas sp. SH203 TaxID=345167 RepID=UPI0009CFED37|nr:hypothetical protein [Brevundimonas sp. SH203]GAW39654.1 hypothetical protein SH203_00029 [Brevundimonas sp. SH203]
MTFLSLPLWGVLAGAAALAALLFALQILKARQKRVRIATAGLWAQAVRAAPLRVFRSRFRRWLAYLLVLAIALSLWIAGARPELAPRADAERQVFYLDASAGLTARDDFAQAKRALLADVRATDPAQRIVYLGDATATPLLRPGETVALLAKRLDAVRAEARPSDFARFMATAPFRADRTGVRATIRFYGAAFDARTAKPADGARVTYGYLAAPVPDNRGVVTLGASPAASGLADRADVLVRAIDGRGRPLAASDLVFRQNDKTVAPTVVASANGLIVRDVMADGGVFEARLARGDAFSADDRAALRLPDRRRLRIALSPGAPTSVRRVVLLDTGLEITGPDQAQVAVRRSGEAFAQGLPTLEITADRAQPAFVVAHRADDAAPDLAGDAEALGLDGLDVAALARKADRPVAVEAAEGPRRGLAIWSLLFENGGGFTASADFPVFVTRSLRWLSNPAPWIPFAAAGQDLVDESDLYGLIADRRVAARALNGDLYLGRAGETRIGDLSIQTSLVDPAVTQGVARPIPAGLSVVRAHGAAVDLIFILLAAFAGLLLLLEWRLTRRGVMA